MTEGDRSKRGRVDDAERMERITFDVVAFAACRKEAMVEVTIVSRHNGPLAMGVANGMPYDAKTFL